MGGVLPFGCIFIQLFFVLNSIWSSHVYYMYGFLFLVFVILIITCSETTILLCYFHLCAEVINAHTKGRLDIAFNLIVYAGLQLVVAQLPHLWLHGVLPGHLLRPLLRHEARDRGRHVHIPLLRIHLHHGVHILLVDW